MEKIQFDLEHQSESLNQSFNISNERRIYLMGSIYFHYFYRNYLAETLFDEDKVPDNFNRKSNVLEDILNESCETVNEQIYAALEWGRWDGKLQDENKGTVIMMMMIDAKLAKLKYDKEKFIDWFREKMENAEKM